MLAQFKADILPFFLSTRVMVAARSEDLLELEAMAATLLEAACKLPPGETRHGVLKEIGRLRARIGRLLAMATAMIHPEAKSGPPTGF